jgi:hypothetical protein
MNGFYRIGPVGLFILTFGGIGAVQADQTSMAANESACHREKVSTELSKAPFRSLDLPVTLASHQCDGTRCYTVLKDSDKETEENTPSSTAKAIACEEPEIILQSNTAPPVIQPTSPLGCSLGRHEPIRERSAAIDIRPSIEQDYVELRVLNAELVARLEMTQAILELQNLYTDQILSLERQNAQLIAEAAELRVKNEVNEQLTAGLIERTELSARLTAAHDWISSRTAYEASLPVQAHPSAVVANPSYEEVISSIQEDLSNLRRQLPLIKRAPVPFAISNSLARESKYVPVGEKPGSTETVSEQCPTADQADAACREAATQAIGAR